MTNREVELVRRARGGDQGAFETLFRKYQNTMYRLALHFIGSPEAAADATQDAFVRAWERLGSLRDDRAFGGWLRSILLHIVRDQHRKRRDVVRIEDEPGLAERLPDAGALVENKVVALQRDEEINTAVMTLPEHQRTVVVMHHLEGKSVEEIVRELGLKKGTVISRLARGRKALKRKLAGKLRG